MVRKENKVQTAIASALQVYCEKKNLRLFEPYANQQGDRLRLYCSDLMGVLDGADLIALEVKELDVSNGLLKSFDDAQHRAAIQFEQIGVPLAYAYNEIDVDQLPYEQYPHPTDWASRTLKAIRRSKPTPLPGPKPSINEHQTLLEWLDGHHGVEGLELFGRVHGAIKKVDDLRNGILVLLYSVSRSTMAALDATELEIVVRTLKKKKRNLDPKQISQLATILAAEADIFKKFSLPSPAPTATNSMASSGPPRPKKRKGI